MAYIIGTAYASTCYQIEFRIVLQYLLIQRYRWSLQHSVTTDISTDNLTDPLLYIVFQERKQFAATLILPTIDGYFMLFHISTKNNLLGAIHLKPLTEQFGILHSNAAAGHHLRTVLKSYHQIFITLHPTSKINNKRRTHSYLFQRAVVYHMMGSRTVQIDHMKSTDTMSLQLQGHFHGIFVVHLLAVIIALGKAYTFSVNNVNSGNQFYHFIYDLTIYSSRKFRKIRSPTLPLFSGWNCVA